MGGGHFLKENPQESFIWLDFGYNFDGHQFIDKSQFHFALTPNPNLSHDKINLFSLGNIDSNHLPHILINGTSHFLAGGIIYGGASAWQKFHKRIKEALKAFISFQIIDDDQKLYLWIVRNYPSECMVWEIDDWFNALFYFVPKHLKDSIKIKKDSMLKSSKYCIKNISNDIYAPKRKDSTHSKDLMYSLKTASIWQRIRRFLRRILRRF